MGRDKATDMLDFELGDPALVCRWRLANRRLPIENRHLRALLARTVNGAKVTTELAAWAKQHIEWNLDQGAVRYPDGVLMLIVDTEGRAAMTVGPFEELADASLAALALRAANAQAEAEQTGVAPETLWLARGDVLLWDPGDGCAASGAASLVGQLAQTLGLGVARREGLAHDALAGALEFDEAFLVSDEYGIVPAADAQGQHGRRMREGYQRLLKRTH